MCSKIFRVFSLSHVLENFFFRNFSEEEVFVDFLGNLPPEIFKVTICGDNVEKVLNQTNSTDSNQVKSAGKNVTSGVCSVTSVLSNSHDSTISVYSEPKKNKSVDLFVKLNIKVQIV